MLLRQLEKAKEDKEETTPVVVENFHVDDNRRPTRGTKIRSGVTS